MSAGATPTPPTSPTARTTSSASTTCATTWPVSLDYQVQRERHFAIVDEVDNILIDEARTPLIISGPAEDSAARLPDASPASCRSCSAKTDYTVDEKAARGARSPKRASRRSRSCSSIDNIYAPENYRLTRYMEAALKAQIIYKRDVDYVVKDGEVVIVDDFTGRLMFGRRWSDGLHQAVEAKEGVKIQNESITYATITLQNYFRLYDKLAGMTGTAATEGEEFFKIYKLEVVVIPTQPRRWSARTINDLVYRTRAREVRRRRRGDRGAARGRAGRSSSARSRSRSRSTSRSCSSARASSTRC